MAIESHRLDTTFAALSDPTAARSSPGSRSAKRRSPSSQPFALSQPTISKHLKVLERRADRDRSRRHSAAPAASRPKRDEGHCRLDRAVPDALGTPLRQSRKPPRQHDAPRRNDDARHRPGRRAPGFEIDRDTHTLRFVRDFAAPRELVFTGLDHGRACPAGGMPAASRLTECEMDLRPGGSFRFVSRGHRAHALHRHL
jgi:hypothetical protein